MKQLVIGLCFAVAATSYAFAEDKTKDSDRKASAVADKSIKHDAAKSDDKKTDSRSEKKVRREPTEKQKAVQARMKDCAAKAGDRKGDERKKFMSECLSKA
jgi:hypothetical protein